jgi:ATP-dependent 26S proteasome regulatory subunit
MDPSSHPLSEQAEPRCRTLYWGADILQLAYVEVRPLEGTSPSLTAAFVKHRIMQDSFPQMVPGAPRIVWEDASSTIVQVSKDQNAYLLSGSLRDMEMNEGESLFYFPSNDPSSTNTWPCRCTGYALLWNQVDAKLHSESPPSHLLVDQSTLVQILLPIDGSSTTKYQHTGEVARPRVDPSLQRSLFAAHNPESIVELRFRLQRLLLEPLWIGTSPDAVTSFRRQVDARRDRARHLHAATAAGRPHPRRSHTNPQVHSLFSDAALLVHSPEHGAGKTALVECLAQELQCVVQVLAPGPLWAQFGIHADAALACVVHSIVLQAAVRQQSLCLILDDWSAFLPSQELDVYDSVGPGVASYLHSLVTSLQDRREIPFPQSNPLYHFGGSVHGIGLPVRLCVVAIMTCSDQDRRLHQASHMGLYRLPDLTSKTRNRAFQRALAEEELTPCETLRRKLPHLAAAAVWARGTLFQRVALEIRHCLMRRRNPETHEVIVDDFVEALHAVGQHIGAAGCQVQFLAASEDDDDATRFDVHVGGNEEAKASLQDALALDPRRRALMASLGLSPNTGLLLYGPPGTGRFRFFYLVFIQTQYRTTNLLLTIRFLILEFSGKTLLAKAVAKALRSPGSSLGGAFLSLSTSDIVRAEVGVSEKLVAAAFQTARANAPAVVFIDEFQALFTERSGSNSSRLTSTLLQCMDDLKEWADLSRQNPVATNDDLEKKESRVLVLAATNTPWMIDRAFLRPGRFDRSVLVDLPRHEERVSILRIHTDRMNAGFSHSPPTAFLEEISRRTAGFSGADLASLCRAAAVLCLGEDSERVEEKHFWEALENGMKPSSNVSLVKRITEWHP